MTSRLFAISVIGLCWVVPLRADTLVMIGGERIQGEIVGETPSDVSIRRTNKTGNIRFVQKIRRVNIASIERSATQPASVRSQDFSSSRPAEAERSTPAARIADKPAFLEGAILKYEKPDYYAAGLDLNLLIVNSTPGELQQFSATVTDRLNMSLAEMAASAHFNAAMERSRGRAVQLPPVTDYEKPVLIPMLEEAYERALQTQVETEPETADRPRGREATDGRHEAAVGGGEGFGRGPRRPMDQNARDPRRLLQPPGRADAPAGAAPGGGVLNRFGEQGENAAIAGTSDLAPTSRPTLNVASWLDRPEEFDGNRQEASALMIQIYHARSLLAERMRLDPEVRTDQELKAELVAERARVDALLKSVKARAGGALTPAEREALEAQFRNRMDAAMREQWRRQNAAFSELERIRQQQLQQQGIGVPPPGSGRETE